MTLGEASIRANRCPKCGALPGQPCLHPSGRVHIPSHAARFYLVATTLKRKE